MDSMVGLINTYKAQDNKTSSDYLQLAKKITDAYTYYPLPLVDILNLIKNNITEPSHIVQFLSLIHISVESKLEDEDVKSDTQDTPEENTQQNANEEVKQGLTEEEYYIIIKEAKKRQQDYIDSIDDPKVKQSVQTSYAAAVAESSFLYIKYPEDTDTIDAALKRVLNGE